MYTVTLWKLGGDSIGVSVKKESREVTCKPLAWALAAGPSSFASGSASGAAPERRKYSDGRYFSQPRTPTLVPDLGPASRILPVAGEPALANTFSLEAFLDDG